MFFKDSSGLDESFDEFTDEDFTDEEQVTEVRYHKQPFEQYIHTVSRYGIIFPQYTHTY